MIEKHDIYKLLVFKIATFIKKKWKDLKRDRKKKPGY
jgi:hypothetical protein